MESSTIQERFDNMIRSLSREIMNDNLTAAMDVLNDFSVSNSDVIDKTAWLKNKMYSWHGLVLEKQGNLEAAMDMYLKVHHESHNDDYIQGQTMIAALYVRLKENEKALQVLNDLLRKKIKYVIEHGLAILMIYCDILAQSDILIDGSFYALLDEAISQLDIKDISAGNYNRDNFCEMIIKMKQENRSANRRYQEVCLMLYSENDREKKEELLKKYIASENVGYYRSMAVKRLEQPGDDLM